MILHTLVIKQGLELYILINYCGYDSKETYIPKRNKFIK